MVAQLKSPSSLSRRAEDRSLDPTLLFALIVVAVLLVAANPMRSAMENFMFVICGLLVEGGEKT